MMGRAHGCSSGKRSAMINAAARAARLAILKVRVGPNWFQLYPEYKAPSAPPVPASAAYRAWP